MVYTHDRNIICKKHFSYKKRPDMLVYLIKPHTLQLPLAGELKTGQVAGGRTSGEDAEKSTKLGIRNDRIHWFDDNLDSIRAPGVSSAIKKMDDIIFQTTSGLPYRMEGRTKVILQVYSFFERKDFLMKMK